MRYTTRIIVPPRLRRSGPPGNPGAGPRPQSIGVRKSLGFGDLLGAAGAAHAAVAAAHPEFIPFFAQHLASAEVPARVRGQTLAAAAQAVGLARFRQPWGADAGGLRTPADVEAAAQAGYTYFTFDFAGDVQDDALTLSADELAAAVDALILEGVLPEDWIAAYADREVEIAGIARLILTGEPLRRAAVRFAHALRHAERLAETVARACRGRTFEIEFSLAGVRAPISLIEHIVLGLELEARGIRLTGLCLVFDAADPAAFGTALREHAAIASFCGPYKLCFHTEDFTADQLAAIGRNCGDHVHLKTRLETLSETHRIVYRVDLELWNRLLTSAGVELIADDTEAVYLDNPAGLRRLDAAVSSLLQRADDETRALRESLLELLTRHGDIYEEMIVGRFDRLIADFNGG